MYDDGCSTHGPRTILAFRMIGRLLLRRCGPSRLDIGRQLCKRDSGGIPTDIDPFTVYGFLQSGLTN